MNSFARGVKRVHAAIRNDRPQWSPNRGGSGQGGRSSQRSAEGATPKKRAFFPIGARDRRLAEPLIAGAACQHPGSPPEAIRWSPTSGCPAYPATNPALPPLVRDWPEPWREDYEERAAIMEFESGLSRSVAELRAREIVAARYARAQAEARHA
jgi:hypothetical protein